jgi:hypothetical protein
MYQDMSPEERAAAKERARERYQSMSPEQRKEWQEKMQQKRKNRKKNKDNGTAVETDRQ